MLRTALLACALGLSGCATWSTQDRWLLGALVACNAADTVQTRNAVRDGEAREGNPLLGERPSDGRLFAVKFGQGYLIGRAADREPEHRTSILVATTAICAAIVANNHYQMNR